MEEKYLFLIMDYKRLNLANNSGKVNWEGELCQKSCSKDMSMKKQLNVH